MSSEDHRVTSPLPRPLPLPLANLENKIQNKSSQCLRHWSPVHPGINLETYHKSCSRTLFTGDYVALINTKCCDSAMAYPGCSGNSSAGLVECHLLTFPYTTGHLPLELAIGVLPPLFLQDTTETFTQRPSQCQEREYQIRSGGNCQLRQNKFLDIPQPPGSRSDHPINYSNPKASIAVQLRYSPECSFSH